MADMEKGKLFGYFINLHERGEFHADVRNEQQKSILEIKDSWIFEDGFMKNTEDLDGLRDYLLSIGLIHKNDQLLDGPEFEEKLTLKQMEDQPAKPILSVVIEGGIVQAVISNDPDRFPIDEVVVIDYDTEGADAADIYDVPQPDGSTVQAFASITVFEKSGIDLGNVVAQIQDRP